MLISIMILIKYPAMKIVDSYKRESWICMGEYRFKGSQNYVASEELLQAANIAMALQKPLLIKGEPGTGKTMLAEAISQAMKKNLIIWNYK